MNSLTRVTFASALTAVSSAVTVQQEEDMLYWLQLWAGEDDYLRELITEVVGDSKFHDDAEL